MSTPLKKGLGSYAKKSKGNRGYKMSGPSLLKMVADSKPSPITNEFGIGKGTSPYKEEDGGGGGGEKGAGWKKAAGIFLAGINNVYGDPNAPLSSDRLKKTAEELAQEKADKETLTLAQQIIADNKKKG